MIYSEKVLICYNRTVRIIANIIRPYINMLLAVSAKYLITSINMKVGKVKNLTWRQFVDTLYSVFMCFSFYRYHLQCVFLV